MTQDKEIYFRNYEILESESVDKYTFNNPKLLKDIYNKQREHYNYTNEELLFICHIMACSSGRLFFYGPEYALNNLHHFISNYSKTKINELKNSLTEKTGLENIKDIINRCCRDITTELPKS